jgi:hypothetical protein
MAGDMNEQDFCYRVPSGPERPLMHFEDLADAVAYAQACLDADCIEERAPDGSWRVLEREGELVSRRTGFYVMEYYRAPWRKR